jgi:hypothetical protein
VPLFLAFCTFSVLAGSLAGSLAVLGLLRFYRVVDWWKMSDWESHNPPLSIYFVQSERSGSSNGRLTVYVSVHDHCWGRLGAILEVILILRHGWVHIAVELALG